MEKVGALVLIWKSSAELSADPCKEPPKRHRGRAAKLKGSEGKGEAAGNNLGHKPVQEAQSSGGRKGQDGRTDEYLKLKPQKHEKTGLILMGYGAFVQTTLPSSSWGSAPTPTGLPGLLAATSAQTPARGFPSPEGQEKAFTTPCVHPGQRRAQPQPCWVCDPPVPLLAPLPSPQPGLCRTGCVPSARLAPGQPSVPRASLPSKHLQF